MPTFSAHDGTNLAYHVFGDGPLVVCLPGGPTDSAYLGDLGRLSTHRQLIRLDLRGTGQSATPQDIASCRCDRLVDDVEALREHLGLAQLDLLAHSAGANLAALYVSRHPENVSKLALITPSVRAVGLTITGDLRLETAQLRRDEPWFPEAFAALESIVAGRATADSWTAIAPFSRACPCAQTDRPGRAEPAANHAPWQHEFGALSARDDAAGLGRRKPGSGDRPAGAGRRGWRNANARHRDVLAAERRERARVRSEEGIRWGGRPLSAAA